MGSRAREVRSRAKLVLRHAPLDAEQRATLLAQAAYKGSPHHKRNPGDFDLTPPAAPRPDKTLCDEAGIKLRAEATELLHQAIEGGLVGVDGATAGIPRRLWVVRVDGQVFEAKQTGSSGADYHGFPVRKSEPLYDEVVDAWDRQRRG